MSDSERSHDEAMAEALRADPTYAAELRAALTAEGVVDELAILDRQLALGGSDTHDFFPVEPLPD
ncbi:hypothetical protein D3C75_494190 [compost metagenome]